jgi:hypothetical protein
MNNKCQTRSLLCSFFQYVDTQFQCKIKCIRSDNGIEFQMTEFFNSKGVIHQLSYVETPQQNSVVERKHQHMLNVACSLWFQAHLPLPFWGECVLSAVHIINQIPTPILSNISPFEKLFHNPHSLSHFRVFGYLCFVSTSSHHRTKFASRAKPCIFIGYPFGIKGYKVFDLHSKSILVSRDVIFHEDIFLYKTTTYPPVSNDSSFIHNSVLPFSISDSTCDPLIHSPIVSDYACDPLIHSPVVTTSSSDNHTSSVPVSVNPSNLVYVSDIDVPVIPTRKSSRVRQQPTYLHEYHCQLVDSSHFTTQPSSSLTTDQSDSGIPHSFSSVLSYSRLSPSHKHFALSISTSIEPQFFHQAVKHACWREAMKSEIDALESNQTWTLAHLPP